METLFKNKGDTLQKCRKWDTLYKLRLSRMALRAKSLFCNKKKASLILLPMSSGVAGLEKQ